MVTYAKISPKNGEPQRYSWRTQKKKIPDYTIIHRDEKTNNKTDQLVYISDTISYKHLSPFRPAGSGSCLDSVCIMCVCARACMCVRVTERESSAPWMGSSIPVHLDPYWYTVPRQPVSVHSVLPPRTASPSGKASASRAEDPGFESRLRRDFFGVESYLWLKNWHSSGYPARRLAL